MTSFRSFINGCLWNRSPLMNKQSASISFVCSMIIRNVSLIAWARSLPHGLLASGHIPQWISPVWMNFMSASCWFMVGVPPPGALADNVPGG